MADANEEVPVVVVPDMDDQPEAINTDLVITGTADDVEVCAILLPRILKLFPRIWSPLTV